VKGVWGIKKANLNVYIARRGNRRREKTRRKFLFFDRSPSIDEELGK